MHRLSAFRGRAVVVPLALGFLAMIRMQKSHVAPPVKTGKMGMES